MNSLGFSSIRYPSYRRGGGEGVGTAQGWWDGTRPLRLLRGCA